MVLIHCKRLPKEEYSKEFDEFLLSAPNVTNVGEVTDVLQRMQNLRVRLRWMVASAKQLAKENCPSEDIKHHLVGPADDAERYLDLSRVEQKLETKLDELLTLIDSIKGGAMIVFPEHCSGPDALARLTSLLEKESASDVEKSRAHRLLSIIDDGAITDDILMGQVTMWWSGKPMAREADLAKYTGKNDKTKIIVKLAKDGAPAPPREPAVDAKTQSELMAFYYRKQEEQKKLVDDDDISFGNSDWANPHGLKGQLLGMDSVKFRPQ